MRAMSRTTNGGVCFDSSYDSLSVADLRKELDGCGLDVDCSREMLIGRLRSLEESEWTMRLVRGVGFCPCSVSRNQR